MPVSIAIAAVLGIVVLSYTQTVKAYETSGGAYVVAKENLGTLPSLVAAAALMVDYVLDRRRSRSLPACSRSRRRRRRSRPTRSGCRCSLILLLTVVNLRGVRESGIAFALPTYSFVAVMYVMIGTGRREVRGRAAARRPTSPIRSRSARRAASASSSSSGRSPPALRR